MKFKLSNFVLLAKGWYRIPDATPQEYFEGIQKIFQADGFQPDFYKDMADILTANWKLQINVLEMLEYLKTRTEAGNDLYETLIYYFIQEARFLQSEDWVVIPPSKEVGFIPHPQEIIDSFFTIKN